MIPEFLLLRPGGDVIGFLFTFEQLHILREAGSSQPITGLPGFDLCKQGEGDQSLRAPPALRGGMFAPHQSDVYRV